MGIDKLIRLRGWLTLDEAARELSTTLRRDVSHADMYRLALDGHLALSVYIPVVGIDAMCFGNDTEERPTQHRRIDGIWELPMIGPARSEMESRSFHRVSMGGTEGVIVQRDGERCQLPFDPSAWPFRFPSAVPREAFVVVQVAALDDFAARFNSLDAKPLGPRERATLLTIIAALAKELGIDVSKPSAAAKRIEELTDKINARIPARTVSDHLRSIPDALDRRDSSS